MLTLTVEKRDPKAATLSVLRGKGLVPAVVYGAHTESQAIMVDGKAFSKVLRDAGEATESTIVSLAGLGATVPTLIQEITHDPLTGSPLHVDFYAVTKGEKVEVAIPLTFIGESEAVAAGANLVKVLHEVEVRADPMNLPHSIEVDIAVLSAVDMQIHVKDLALPKGVELVTPLEEVIALTQAVVEEKVEAAPADISSIEVEKKGKEEGGEAGEAEAKAE
jgi:large subunit ribosomal protein L25